MQRVVEAHDREGNDLPLNDTNGTAVNSVTEKTSRDSGVHM